MASVASRARGCLLGPLNPPRRATNPSPGPRRLVKTPVAVHPLPREEGWRFNISHPLPRAEGEDPISGVGHDPNSGSPRKTVLAAALRWVCVGLCGLFLFGCRLDMHVQPKYKPLDPSTFFDDGSPRGRKFQAPWRTGIYAPTNFCSRARSMENRRRPFHSPSRVRCWSAAASATTSTARPVTTTRAVDGGWSSKEVSRLRLLITWSDW